MPQVGFAFSGLGCLYLLASASKPIWTPFIFLEKSRSCKRQFFWPISDIYPKMRQVVPTSRSVCLSGLTRKGARDEYSVLPDGRQFTQTAVFTTSYKSWFLECKDSLNSVFHSILLMWFFKCEIFSRSFYFHTSLLNISHLFCTHYHCSHFVF